MKNMKIRLLIIATLFIACAGSPKAQSPYHHIGDVVNNPDSIYWLGDWTVDNWLATPNHPLHLTSLGLLANPSRYFKTCLDNNSNNSTAMYPDLSLVGELLRCCYTPDSIKVIGLAAVAYTCVDGNYSHTPFYYLHDTLSLYVGSRKNPELSRKVKWSMQDSARWIRPYSCGSVIHPNGSPNLITNGGCCTTEFAGGRKWLPLKEYYFEDYGMDPVYVIDSFFVGCTHSYYSNVLPYSQLEPDDSVHHLETGYLFYGYDSAAVDSCPTCESFPKYEYLIKRTGRHPSFYPLNEWISEEWRWYLAVWPIIDLHNDLPPIPQYVCPAVQNIRTTYFDGAAVILWDANSEHSSWQLSYGPQGIEPDSGTIVNCPIMAGQVFIDTGQHYSAFVRAKCIHDDSVYFSDWSDSIDLFISDSIPEEPPIDDTTGIGIGTVASRFVTLMPNPTHDVVQVVSSFGINRIEVYNLQGLLMAETKASGTTVSVNTRDWPDAVYFVIIHTPAGSFSKRLVVKK